MTKIDRPPWIDFVALRDCTMRTGAVTSMTTAVVAIMSWIRLVLVPRFNIHAALIGRSV